jgi:hypothetical protein
VELRLTARLQLRTNQSLSLLDLINEEEMSPARRQGFPGVALSAAPRADDPASDAPCRAPQTPIAEPMRSARTASTALASTRAASPIRGAFHRQVLSLPLSRYRFRGESPPPFSQLCRREPASGALSLFSSALAGKS